MSRALSLACLFLLLGASQAHRAESAPAPLPRRPTAPPPAWIIDALNDNARRADGLIRADVDFDFRMGKQAIGLSGVVIADRTGRARLRARVLGMHALDVGHNGKSSWWLRFREKSDVVRIDHTANQTGDKHPWEWPVTPDWLPVILGVVEYGQPRDYLARRKGDVMELVKLTESPRGEKVRRVIVVEVSGNEVRVIGHKLEDAHGKVLCSVSVTRTERLRNGFVIPVRLNGSYQGEVALKLMLSSVVSEPLTKAHNKDFEAPE